MVCLGNICINTLHKWDNDDDDDNNNVAQIVNKEQLQNYIHQKHGLFQVYNYKYLHKGGNKDDGGGGGGGGGDDDDDDNDEDKYLGQLSQYGDWL